MLFKQLDLINDGRELNAVVEGHATDVVQAFLDVCNAVMGSKGPWRLYFVSAYCPDDEPHDSKMVWNLKAKVKSHSHNHCDTI